MLRRFGWLSMTVLRQDPLYRKGTWKAGFYAAMTTQSPGLADNQSPEL